MMRNAKGSALGPLLLTLHVHSFNKQTKGGPTIRKDETHLIPNPKSWVYHFLIVCSKANHLNFFSIIVKVEVQIPLPPRTFVTNKCEENFAT